MRRTPRTLLPILLLGAAACTVGPDYEPPAVDAGDGWTAETPEGAPLELERWWTALGDETLDRLEEAALAANLDLAMAVERVARARAVRDAVAGGREPRAAAAGSVTRRQQSENGALPIGRLPGIDRTQTIWEAGFDASWELDLFGRVRRGVEAASAEVDVRREELQAARTSVAAEVARRYLEARGAQDVIAATERELDLARRALELVREQARLGEVPAASVVARETEVAALEAELPALETGYRAAALSIGVLLGEPPEAGLAWLEEPAWELVLEPFPVAERAEILGRRPDVRAAERRLAAATARIGVATGELYPKVAIVAGGGFQSLELEDLPEAGSTYGSITPLISWRFLDGGRVRAEIRGAEASAREAAHAYTQTVLGALTDAEVGLARYRGKLAEVGRLEKVVERTRESLGIASARRRAGETSMLEVLEAQERVLEAELGLVRRRVEASLGMVALCKALGGGW